MVVGMVSRTVGIALALAALAAPTALGHPPKPGERGATYIDGERAGTFIQLRGSKAQASHTSGISCFTWADRDGHHPDAPGSYDTYHCHEPDGQWANVHGKGRASQTWHRVLMHHWHGSGGTSIWDSMSHEHGH